MKKLLAVLLLAGIGIMNIGYYSRLDDGDSTNVYFIKKHPTYHIKFENIYANDGDDRTLDQLDSELKQLVINYCKYRLGIETELKTQAELDACKQR
ncbi:hypothetical protein B9K09_07380 [Pseudomonas sp. M30-35]|nr:hypothetical protein B9K09_07380 [Pseudomonas sp. M30-35]